MTDPIPRRLSSRIQRDRVKTVTRRQSPGSDDGQSGWTRRTQRNGQRPAQQLGGWIMYVFHGDDPNVARPACLLARWIGAAYPVNRSLTDDWLNVTLTDDQIAGLG